jgi:hypothetical protein
MQTWNIILCHSPAEVTAAQTWIRGSWPSGTTCYFEKEPPAAPPAAGMNVVVFEYIGGAVVIRVPKAGDNGPFYVLHAITP